MNCEKCNSVISEGQNFCPKCGADFRRMEKKVCPNCNFHLAEDMLFCSNCGQKIQIDQECKEAEAFVKAKNNKRLVKILTSCIIGVLIIIAIVYACMQNTVEKKLTKHEWWEEEMGVFAQPTYKGM